MTARSLLATRRRDRGYSQEALAQELGVHPTTISRWETGTQAPLANQRGQLARVLDLSAQELAALLGGEPESPNGHTVPLWLSHYASLEQGAASLKRFDTVTIPGLLQTWRYAEAVMRTYYHPATAEQVDLRVKARMARAAVLRRPEPLEYHCIIDEGILSRPAGGSDVMTEQLQHLVTLGRQPNVTLQVVPINSDGLHCAAFGSFDLFTAKEGASPFMACTETVSGFNYVDGLQAVQEYSLLFKHLTRAALSPDASADLITHTNARKKQ